MKKYYLYIFFVIIFIASLLVPSLIKEEKEEIIVNPVIKEEVKEEVIKLVKVDIKGSVKKPGVYELEPDKRVIDVISKAGGLLKDADTSAINLSKMIFDEMAIYIYKKAEEIVLQCPVIEVLECPVLECPVLENNACIEEETTTKVSLNTATKEQLMTLTGIGETKAIDIINYRNTNKFKTIEEIMNVSGIGESTFNKIKDLITI